MGSLLDLQYFESALPDHGRILFFRACRAFEDRRFVLRMKCIVGGITYDVEDLLGKGTIRHRPCCLTVSNDSSTSFWSR